ncbi:MAG: glutaredoxin family protein [Acidimicrobiia bacterium]|nr:glutaredoxin family protein [Acidimicrobiia bacterium]
MARSIRLLTRPGCTLCHEALGRLRPWADRLGLTVVLEDIEDDRALTERYGFRIPVLLSERGAELAEGRIGSLGVAVAAIRARLGRSGPPD